MGTINFNKFREKMEQAKQKKSVQAGQINWMKLDAGKRYNLRFLPLKNENYELPFSVFHHHAITFPDGHYENIACPKRTDGSDCPFCKLATEQYKKYVDTDDISYKDAFKKLVAKTHWLLVGFEPDEIDEDNLSEMDVKVVRASSKQNMELIENKLAKEIDFIDFEKGRNVELLKSKSKGNVKGTDITTITWDFGDPSVAVKGKNGKDIWDKLVELSPDLSSLINPLSPDKLEAKFVDFTKQPVVAEDNSDDDVDTPTPVNMEKKATPPLVQKQPEATLDLDELNRMLQENN